MEETLRSSKRSKVRIRVYVSDTILPLAGSATKSVQKCVTKRHSGDGRVLRSAVDHSSPGVKTRSMAFQLLAL
jgi:hypothetical protein